jgi:pilus assembly protein CpaD
VRKVIAMIQRSPSAFAAAIALSLGLTLSACGDQPNNPSLSSVNQPVVERSNFALDVAAGADGLTIPEQQRLAGWFETMDLRYGDRVAIDGASASAVREDVAALAARHGLLLSDAAPVTGGFLQPGTVRVVVTRTKAYVPDCPDWSDSYNANLGNNTSDNYGCAVNSNIAAMVADPEHLLHGARSNGETVVMSSTKAIETFREAKPTGAGGLPQVSSQGN